MTFLSGDGGRVTVGAWEEPVTMIVNQEREREREKGWRQSEMFYKRSTDEMKVCNEQNEKTNKGGLKTGSEVSERHLLVGLDHEEWE
jgi:hypothetical protein